MNTIGGTTTAVNDGIPPPREERQAFLADDSSEACEKVVDRLLASPRLQSAVEQVLESEGAKRLIDSFFDSGLFERFIDRLLVSDALWRLVDEVAQSPSVTAAVSQQGLGFADQVGAEVRGRSRRADDWLERFAQGLIHRRSAAEAQVRERPAQ